MNRYHPYGSSQYSCDGILEFSRADLWILGTLLGLFATVMASGLLQGGVSNPVWPWATTLVVAVGSAASFWGAIRWRNELQPVKVEPRQVDRFNDRSAAA